MSPRARRHWTTAGVAAPCLVVLGLLQQLAVTRQSFVQASSGRDALVLALTATQDTLAAVRKHDARVTRQLKACRRARHSTAAVEPVGPIGPPEPAREGTLLRSLGHAASAIGGGVVHGIRWILGG